MKTSHTNLKSSLIFSLIICAFPLWAKPVAVVTEVNGQVFVVALDGTTKAVKAKDILQEKSELMVGEEGEITLNDYYDATYHLVQGSHLKFFDKAVQLKKGKAWIQSLNSKTPLVLTSANALVDFSKGEFITTFDQVNSKTQVLVVNGEVDVSNVLDKNTKFTVSAGHFTLLDPETENGLPRNPTKVGLNSLEQALADFKTLPSSLKEKGTAPERSIASVPAEIKKGEIVFMSNGKVTQSERIPASAASGAHRYFKKKIAAKNGTFTSAPIRFYGMNHAAKPVATAVVAPRLPASVKPNLIIAVPHKVGSNLNIDAEFSNSLRMEQASQPKHSKELENLIQDLNSF